MPQQVLERTSVVPLDYPRTISGVPVLSPVSPALHSQPQSKRPKYPKCPKCHGRLIISYGEIECSQCSREYSQTELAEIIRAES